MALTDNSSPTDSRFTALTRAPRLRRLKLPGLSLRTSERRLLLGLVDLLCVNGALVAANLISRDLIQSPDDLAAYSKWFISLTIVWWACAVFFDCYNLARAASTTATIRSTGAAALATTVIYTLVPLVTPPLISRGLLLYFVAFLVVLVVGWRVFYARVFVQPWFQQRAIVVGAGHAGQTLAAALQSASSDANPFRGTGYQLVGFIDDGAARCGDCVTGLPVLGDHTQLVNQARAQQVSQVILAITYREKMSDDLFDALFLCREMGLQVVTMAAVYERLTGRVPLDHVGRDLHMVVPTGDNAGERAYLLLKRLIDLAAAVIGLAICLPVALGATLANRLSSPGPLFYRQRRLGQNGRVFDIFKFRSMQPDAERGVGAVWACADDDRITPIGRWLRRTRLDELPQFYNVLRGEMSLIGPRPERPEFVDELARAIPFYRARHAVKPGLTGWAQIRYRYGNSQIDTRVKLEYDLYYVKHAGLVLDLQIMLQTLPVMLMGKGT
jgi:exopolysaccharide biosynthesis polyprenyl glycosylphosphotransferase